MPPKPAAASSASAQMRHWRPACAAAFAAAPASQSGDLRADGVLVRSRASATAAAMMPARRAAAACPLACSVSSLTSAFRSLAGPGFQREGIAAEQDPRHESLRPVVGQAGDGRRAHRLTLRRAAAELSAGPPQRARRTVSQAQEQQPAGTRAEPDGGLSDLACLPGQRGGGDHRSRASGQQRVEVRPVLLRRVRADRDRDQARSIGTAVGHGGEIVTEQASALRPALRGEEGDVDVDRQGSADRRLERFPERSRLSG